MDASVRRWYLLLARMLLVGLVPATLVFFALSSSASADPPSEPPIVDDFNRPDENPLSDGGKWAVASAGSLKVNANQLACTLGTHCDAWRKDVRYGLDQDVTVKVATAPENGNWVRLYARLQKPGAFDGYSLRYIENAGVDSVLIERINNGTFTGLLTLQKEFLPGDRLRMRVVGSTIEAWHHDNSVGWSKVGETSDSTYLGVGYVGVAIRGTLARGDDFGAASLREPTPAPSSPLDDFNRPDENPLSDGGKWVAASTGALKVSTNQLACTLGTHCDARRKDVRYGLDQEAWITIETRPESGNWVRLYARLQNPSVFDGYSLRYNQIAGALDTVQIERISNGSFTGLLTLQKEFLPGDRLRMRVVGSTIEAWRYDNNTAEWSKLGETSDSTYLGVGYVGVAIRGTLARGDDFGAASLREPTPAPSSPLDDFNRPDETPLSDGGAWTIASSFPLKVSANQLACTQGSTCDAWRNDTLFGPDQEAWVTIETRPEWGNWVRLYARLQKPSAFSGYSLRYNQIAGGLDTVQIERLTNGTFTSLLTLQKEFLPGDRLRMRVVGSTIEAWRYDNFTAGWTKLGEKTDATYTGAGRAGVALRGTLVRVDDFGAENTDSPPSGSSPGPGQSNGTCEGRGTLALSGTVCLSDPVNTLTGAFTTQVQDLATPGTGVAFAWTRSYTSADATIGPLGRGWTHSYAASLAVQANDDVLARGEEGQELYFAKQPDDSFLAAAGGRATLTSVANGYELIRHDQLMYRFDAEGRLLSIKDRNDQGVTLAYDPQGRLQTITDAAGRVVTVTYNASDLVSEVATDDRSISYGYTGGRLTSVTDVRGEIWTYTYDAGERLAMVVDPLNHTHVTNVYGTDGRVMSQTDALEKATTFAWNASTQTATITDARGKVWIDDYTASVLTSQTDPFGHVTLLGYDDDLNQSSVTGPTNQRTTMAYDERGNLLTATAPVSLGAAQKTFTYNERNDPTQVTDARGKVTSYAYDGNGNLETVTQDGVQVGSYAYDAAGRVETFTDGNERTWMYSYVPATGYLQSSTDPLGNRTTYTYDAPGRVATRVDPRGNVAGCSCAADFTWTYTYNTAGQVLTEQDPLGHTTTNVYDDAGRLTSTTDALARVTTYTYDNANRVLTETASDPDGAGPLTAPVTTYTYDDVGNKLTESDPRGNTTAFAYNGANQLTSETGPDPDAGGPQAAPVTTQTYDANGNLASTVEPRGNVSGANPASFRTSFTHDAAGRLLTETRPDPDGAGPALAPKTTNVYDPVGNLQSVKDGNDHTTSYTYDAAGRVLTVTAPDGGNTTYTYDDAGNLLARTDDNDHTSSYAYDDAARLVSETSPDPDGPGPQSAAVTSYTYDANGNLLTITDPNGNATPAAGDGVTTFGYDRTNRQKSIDYSDTTPDVTFTYDAVGNRLTMADGSGTETRTYDSLDRLLTVDRGSSTFSYSYDAASNVTRRTYPGGAGIDYAYDPLNRLATVVDGSNTTSYAYDPASNLVQTTLPSGNGYVESRVYDRAGRLTEVQNQKGATVLSHFVSTLDAAGNPTQVVRAGSLAETQTYTYDANDRITGVCIQAGTCPGGSDPFIRWTYDKAGNRLSEQRSTETTSYTYDDRDRLLTGGATNFAYDYNGNQTQNGARTFTYDLANRLKSTTQGSSTATYLYDGEGKRLEASGGGAPADVTKFLWDPNHGLPQLALERDGNNLLLRSYTYGERRISQTGGSGASYYLYDQLGSVANLASSSGATQWTYAYEPFGTTRVETSNGGPANVMKFTGEYIDPTGLYYLRARQYDPAIARFLAPDPVHQVVGESCESSFAYARNRPTLFGDPSGQIMEPVNRARVAAGDATSFIDSSEHSLAADRKTCPSSYYRADVGTFAKVFEVEWRVLSSEPDAIQYRFEFRFKTAYRFEAKQTVAWAFGTDRSGTYRQLGYNSSFDRRYRRPSQIKPWYAKFSFWTRRNTILRMRARAEFNFPIQISPGVEWTADRYRVACRVPRAR